MAGTSCAISDRSSAGDGLSSLYHMETPFFFEGVGMLPTLAAPHHPPGAPRGAQRSAVLQTQCLSVPLC